MKKKDSAGAGIPIIAVVAAVAAVLAVVALAAGIGLSGLSGGGELLEQRSIDGCSVMIYGHKPALFPEGFLRVKILCRQGENEAVADERTFSFDTESDHEMFSFEESGGALHLTVHDTHGDIVYDIIPSEIFG